jgi:pimeloyl-ACP methyl ester carboxylesterase
MQVAGREQHAAHIFYSDGIRLEGLLHRRKDARAPTVVVCSGLHGLKEWVPAKWAPYFLQAGLHCFAFDYRGFGTSAGVRGRMLPSEEISDTLAALDYLRTLDSVDADRIALLGWGFGAGIAIGAAAQDPRVAAVCAANGAGDYGRTVRDAVAYTTWLDWQDRLAADRIQRATTGVSERVDYRNITNPGFDPGFALHAQFHKDIAAVGQAPQAEFTLQTCEAYAAFQPERMARQLGDRPLLIVHGDRNHYMPVSEAYSLYERAGENTTLRIQHGQTHLEMISAENPASFRIMSETAHWVRDHLLDAADVAGPARG